MFRWSGNQHESDKQAGERAARAARRTISSLPLTVASEFEEEFGDCNTTIGGQLDGEGDESSVVSEAGSDSGAAAIMPDETPFDMEDKANHADAWQKELKIKFDPHDVEYYFNVTVVYVCMFFSKV